MPSTPERVVPSIEMPIIMPSHPGEIMLDVPGFGDSTRPASVRHMYVILHVGAVN